MLDSRANNGSCERTVKFGAEEELLELLRERGGGKLRMTAPLVMQSAASQFIVVCKINTF